MPTTRRSTRSSTGTAAGKQQTLSFKHKVTKAIKTGKEGYRSPARAKEYIPEPSPEPATTPTKIRKTRDHDDIDSQPAPTTPPTTDEQPTAAAAAAAAEQPQTDAELAASQITDKAIEKYWRGIEASRTAQEVHKKHGAGLATGEKVLRYFDVSSQYGPCIGIARIKRWQRAQRLGLNPPVEVLAVLLRGGEGTAHMDRLLNETAVGV